MSFLLKQIGHINIGKIFSIVGEVSQRTGKSRVAVFFDLISCILVYKAGYTDYIAFEMYNMSKEERKLVLTRGRSNFFIKELNPKEYWDIIDDKTQFNKRLAKYLKRDYMVLDGANYQEFLDFIQGKEAFIAKPIDGNSGIGVEKVKTDSAPPEELYRTLTENKKFLLEEVARQHPEMARLHPDSINTIRIVTIRNKRGITSVVYAFQRIGTNHALTDNFHTKGVASPVDIKTGKLYHDAINQDCQEFEFHPTTGVKIVGFQIPCWNQVLELVVEAAQEVPELGLIGWDVYISPEGPGLIEANQYPGHDFIGRFQVLPAFEAAYNKK